MNRIPLHDLRNFVKQVLAAVDADNYQTQVFADALIWSDLIGRPTHGVWRLPAYIKRIGLGLIKCPCQPTYRYGELAVDVMDGDQGIGHYVGHEAMMRAIELARKNGLGAIGVHNSNHFGTGAYYVQLAAAQGMIGVAMSNSIAKVAPHGGVKAVFGTNPFAFGAPRRNGKSLMLDMATTAMAGSQVMKYAEQSLSLPEGIAVDNQGKPILDPKAVEEGVLLTFGGAKGYGLSLMVEIFSSVLSGALFSTQVGSMFNNFEQPSGNGHFFIALDISRFMDLDGYYERMENLLEQVKSSGLQVDSVMIPGETRWDQYEANIANGIPLDASTVTALKKLAEQYAIPTIV
jgi:ureidoglycolate dehydrogenase (NAD+)